MLRIYVTKLKNTQNNPTNMRGRYNIYNKRTPPGGPHQADAPV